MAMSITAIPPSPAASMACGAPTNGSTVRRRAATNPPTGGATTTNTKTPNLLELTSGRRTLEALTNEGGGTPPPDFWGRGTARSAVEAYRGPQPAAGWRGQEGRHGDLGPPQRV